MISQIPVMESIQISPSHSRLPRPGNVEFLPQGAVRFYSLLKNKLFLLKKPPHHHRFQEGWFIRYTGPAIRGSRTGAKK
jgi:hypothetical protein